MGETREGREKAVVLIVDDSLKNVQVLGRLLRDEGYRINVARSGEGALTAALEGPDVILMDAMMPGIDGFEACRRLKQDARTEPIPVLFLTALTTEDAVLRAFNAGAVDYVTKPFKSNELLARVGTHAELRRAQSDRDRHLRDLESAMEQIERIHREQEAFLRHELNNAIGPILGYADMLLGHLTVDPERQRKWLAKIREGANSMHGLLSRMKELHELERGAARLTLEELDLVSLVRDECSKAVKGYAGELEVAFESTETAAMVRGDASLLPGVFTNLIKNAVEHLEGLETPGDHKVTVRLATGDRQVHVSVHNGGEPIPEHLESSFFDKFNSTKPSGTGLGTSYAKIITVAHGGVIALNSDQATGTTVTVALPIADPAGEVDDSVHQEPAERRPGSARFLDGVYQE